MSNNGIMYRLSSVILIINNEEDETKKLIDIDNVKKCEKINI